MNNYQPVTEILNDIDFRYPGWTITYYTLSTSEDHSIQYLSGDLYLPHVIIGHPLPDGMCVSGNMNLMGASIQQLPNKLTVTGNLDLRDCRELDFLPLDLCVGGNIFVRAGGPIITRLIHSDIYQPYLFEKIMVF